MMSVQKSVMSRRVFSNVGRRFATDAEGKIIVPPNFHMINNRASLAALREAPGKKVLYFVSDEIVYYWRDAMIMLSCSIFVTVPINFHFDDYFAFSESNRLPPLDCV